MLKEITVPSSGPILEIGSTRKKGPQTWLTDRRELQWVALRRDWEFRHYALETEPEDLADDSDAEKDTELRSRA